MKVWKIVSGVLSIVISLFVVSQSVFAGVYNILTGNGQSSGTAGIVVAIVMFTGGIVALATSNGSRGGDAAIAILYGIGALTGFFGAGSFLDLYVWASWCLLCAILALVDFVRISRYDDEEKDVAVPVHPTADMRSGPATFQDVILEPDPRRRDAAIDALPERQAKNYLKQALNVLVPRQMAGGMDDDVGLVKALIAILVIIAVFIVGVIGFGAFSSMSRDAQTVNSAPPATSKAVQSSEAVQSQAVESADIPSAGAGTLGDYYVEIKSALLSNDYAGNPVIIITYEWTNNSDSTTSAAVALMEKAFQNGVQIDRATAYSDIPGYESGTSMRDLRPGATTEVQCVFGLPDEAAVVEFEISEFISFSTDTVTMVFDPASLNTIE